MDIARKLEDSSSPLLPLATLRWLDLNLALSHFIPIGAESGSSTFGVALHHRSLGIIISVGENLLEKFVDGRIATSVGILVHGHRFIRFQALFGDAIPVLSLLLGGSGGSGCWLLGE